jgi:hypothetical protein
MVALASASSQQDNPEWRNLSDAPQGPPEMSRQREKWMTGRRIRPEVESAQKS